MPVRPEILPSPSTLEFLKHCFRFVSLEWTHAERLQLPDRGFERHFRESCVQNLPNWAISEHRELWLGAGFNTASGTAHEIDIVARSATATAILEAKNDVIVFFAKVLDYILANSVLASDDICLAFMSRNSFEPRGLAACLGLGIHPIAADIRPLPILVENARLMDNELRRGLAIASDTEERFEDLCAQLNSLSADLNETWMDNRCGYLSDDSLLLKAVTPLQVSALAQQLRQANSDCTDLLKAFRSAKIAGGA